jgi:hypothetical protein
VQSCTDVTADDCHTDTSEPNVAPTRAYGEMNMNNVTRSKVVQVWFAAVVFVAVACFALGLSVPLSTGVMLAVMSLVPPAVMLLLWPGTQPPTVADVLHEGERRG